MDVGNYSFGRIDSPVNMAQKTSISDALKIFTEVNKGK